jgi:putative oxidoreductase
MKTIFALIERYAPLVGRFLLVFLFFLSGVGKIMDWSGTAGYMTAAGLPLVPVLLFFAILIEILGPIMIILGIYTRYTAIIMAGYLILVTPIFHNFWAFHGMERSMQQTNFLKNLAIIGGLLVLAAHGPGPISLDERKPAT